MLLRLVLALCLLLPLAACDQEKVLGQAAFEEPGITARHYADLMQQRKIDTIYAQLVPSMKTEATRMALVRAAALMPDAAPKGVRLVAYKTFMLNGVASYSYTFESEYPSGWALTNVVLEKLEGGYAVLGVQAQELTQSVEETNRFTLVGKGPLHYLFLGLTAANPAFILVTAFLAYRRPIGRRKWLWILFILVGLFPLDFNWTTGQVSFSQMMGFNLLGATAMRTGTAGAWTLSLGLPLGAVLFLLRRRMIAREGAGS